MMKFNIKFWSKICFCLLLGIFFCPLSSHAVNISIDTGGFNQSLAEPELLYPITDDIDLKGEAYLEFKWRRSAFTYTRGYEFRLYKGYQTIASNLILKRTISVNEYPFKVESLIFDLDQVYTWVLYEVTIDGRKSDKGFSSFKIIKK